MSEASESSRHTMKAALAAAALLGRGSDSMIAHISPREARMLQDSGGSGARNPRTGLLEFDGGGDNYVGPPQPTYGPGSPSGLYAWGSYAGPSNLQQGTGDQLAPAALTATAPSDFAPVAPGAAIPSYVTDYQSGALGSLASRYQVDPSQGTTVGTFDVNGQQNYGFMLSNGLFAPAFLPTSGETPTSLNADQQSGLYPAALAGETLQNASGLPTAWTDTNNVLTPTPQALSDAAYNLPNEVKALADTKPDPWAMLGLLGPAIAAGPVGAGLIGSLGAGAIGAGAAGAGAGAAADAGGGIFDLGSLLGTSPAATTALATGDVSGLLGGAGAAAGAEAAGAVGAAADAGGGAVDLTSLGLDPTTASLLGIGGDVGVPGFSAGGVGALTDAGAAVSGLGLPSLSDGNGLFLGATDASPAAVGGGLPLTAPGVAAPSDLGAAGGEFGLGTSSEASSGILGTGAADSSGGFLSGITDPLNSFATKNAGLLKVLGIGASGLSLGADLLKGNAGPSSLTGGSQLNALANQLATPGGLNPTQTANLNTLEGTAQTVNQGQVQNLTNLQNQAQQSGATLQSYLTSGTLPPAVQSAVDQATQAAITNIKAGYASRGIPANSSMEIQDINNTKQNAVTTAAGLMQQLSTQGLSEQTLASTIGQQITGANAQSTQLASNIASQLVSSGLTSAGLSEQIYQALLQDDQAQQTQTGQAISALAAALAGGTTIKLAA